MITVRPSEDRGRFRLGWLDSRHTFSFGSYYDPAHMGFGPLRVINEDRVAPGGGFTPHGHRNMEIISYVVAGGLEHRDSTGAGGVIRPGELQVMSAGSGIRHSEMNASDEVPVHFLQIWIEPSESGTEPGYAERVFERRPGATLLASRDGRDGSLTVRQDVDVYRVLLGADERSEIPITRARGWVQVVAGDLEVEGQTLRTGDGAGVIAEAITLRAPEAVEALVFDLP